MIKIFANKVEKKLKNFWNDIVFHPTDAIEDEWGQQYLNKIAEDKAANAIRIYTIFEEMVKQNENGELEFDFTKNDYRIDYLLSKGFTPFIAYTFIPQWLAAEDDPALIGKRYKGNVLVRSYPKNYQTWGEICRRYTAHIVERYGLETVSKWKLHCYNEPDLHHFFYRKAKDNYTRAMAYSKMYEEFANACVSVSDKLTIGGPALAESEKNFEFLEFFLNYVKEKNLKIDFISFHSYGTFPELIEDKTKPIDVRGAIFNTTNVAQVAKLCGFGHLPLVCDEWGAVTEGYLDKSRVPEMEFRENELYSAYFARMLIMFDELKLPYDEMMICLSGQHNLKGDMLGNRNFFSKSFYPKPIYNAYVLSNKLGGEKLFFYTDLKEEHVAVMPSKHEDGHISVLLCYADDAFNLDLPNVTFDINFSGIEREYKVKYSVIDKTNANCYTKFLELGSPQDASEEVKDVIRKAGELKYEDFGVVTPENPNVTLTMTNNAVVLIELF